MAGNNRRDRVVPNAVKPVVDLSDPLLCALGVRLQAALLTTHPVTPVKGRREEGLH